MDEIMTCFPSSIFIRMLLVRTCMNKLDKVKWVTDYGYLQEALYSYDVFKEFQRIVTIQFRFRYDTYDYDYYNPESYTYDMWVRQVASNFHVLNFLFRCLFREMLT